MRLIFLLIAALLSASNAKSDVFNPIRLPWRRSPASGEGLDCTSWRLAVETNNLQGWKLVPQSCKDYIGNYMQEGQYRRDCEEMAAVAVDYANSFKLAGDGKDVWVFEIDETTLSNLPYHARSDVQFGEADPVPGILSLYNTLLSLGFKTVILTALSDSFEEVRTQNLKRAGYANWTRLIFRAQSEGGMDFKSTKRTELVKEGYRIVGNVGDQWSDLLGPDGGNRAFKVPNPMHYT